MNRESGMRARCGVERSNGGGDDACVYLFESVVVRVREREGVWRLTAHGRALGRGLAWAQACLVGKRAIEIGAGSGVHAIAALKLGVREMDVTDCDEAALRLCVENAGINGVSLGRAVCADWMDFEREGEYDVVISNPPFCKAGTRDRRSYIRRLVAGSGRFLEAGGHLIFVQSSMADFGATERELEEAGFAFVRLHEEREVFRGYYFEEAGFVEESARVCGGFERIDGVLVETLRVYLATLR